jgi:hypothetical protein
MKMKRPSKTVVTKKPSNSSTGSSIDSRDPTRFNPPAKPKKKRAEIIGSKSKSTQSASKKLNPSAKQTMRRPGLVTSRATGG